jgi:hypothetical protein
MPGFDQQHRLLHDLAYRLILCPFWSSYQSCETLGNDEAREGDATDDMTDMMTKKGKGSNHYLQI